MDSEVDISDSKSGCKDQKSKTSGGWLERLPPSIIQRIRDNRNKYNETESRNPSLVLPPEIIEEIFLRLPITSVVQCSLLCKSFRKVATSQNFALMHIKHGYDNSTFLIFHSRCDLVVLFPNYLARLNITSMNGCVGMVKRIDMSLMFDYFVIGSCHGYLCLVSQAGPPIKRGLLLYNPLTGHFKELPGPSQVPDFGSFFAYGFGYHVGTGEYKVLMAAYGKKRFGFDGEEEQLEVQILTIGMNMWRTLLTPSCWLDEDGASRLFIYKRRALWMNGSLYWLTATYPVISEDWEHPGTTQIIAFDLAAEEFKEITPPTGSSDLLSIRGKLSAFVNHKQGSWEIWVMEDFDVPGSWTRVFVLGHYKPAALRHSNSSNVNDLSSNANDLIIDDYDDDPNNDDDDDPNIDDYDLTLSNVRVVCQLNNGKLLLKFGCEAWCYYDPETELYEDLTLHGLPKQFDTIAHVGSLNCLETL